MSLYQRLQELNPAFVDLDRWGQLAWFIPKSDYAAKVQIQIVLDKDSLPGTNEVPGDGRVLHRPSTKRERKSVIIYVPSCAGITVQAVQSITEPDAFEVDGELWAVKRVMGDDPAGQDLFCERSDFSRIRNWILVG